MAVKWEAPGGGTYVIPDNVDAGVFITELCKQMGWPSPWASEPRAATTSIWQELPEGADPDLFEWWMGTAWRDFVKTVPKATEYGGNAGPATDLLLIGRNLAELCGMHDAPDSLLMELGVWFYMQGKVARLVADYQQKRPGKADTWFDAEVYAKMARRIQETGSWP